MEQPTNAADREGDLESLLASCLEQTLAGNCPDLLAAADGDRSLADRLKESLDAALRLLRAPLESPIPRRLGPFLIEEELGRGGMGTVFLGRHETFGHRVALKVLPPPFAYIDEGRARFTREAQAMALVHHAGVLRVHEVGEHAGTPYAALEYIEGGSIEDLLVEMRSMELVSARELGQSRLPGPGRYE